MHLLLVALLFVPLYSFASGQKSDCRAILVQDYSQASEFKVHATVAPATVDELKAIVRTTDRPIAVRGAGFSMGGHTAAANGIVVDMHKLNQVLEYNPAQRTLRIQAGATWRQVQEMIDPDNLSVMIMQSYNNFQIGGSLSVNAHGRYSGYGPLITSVEEITVMLADGSTLRASRTENADLFNGAIGGYAGLGIILDAKLKLVENVRLERRVASFVNQNLSLATEQFLHHYEQIVSKNPRVQMINADIYPPSYNTVTCITYEQTDRDATIPDRLQPAALKGIPGFVQSVKLSLEQLFHQVKWLRGRVVATEELSEDRVVNRNWEASYDNADLKPLNDRFPLLRKLLPISNRKALLQEYFIPKDQLPGFLKKLTEILKDKKVNVSNISLRHVPQNTESVLSWSNKESFAVVIYYSQLYGRRRTQYLESAQDWTREVVAAAEERGGSFYLPYQVYATRDQFDRAYPRSREFFELKAKYDPTGKFNNSLWEQYRLSEDTYFYRDLVATEEGRAELREYFTNIFSINDPERFLKAIEVAMENTLAHRRDLNDRNIYDELRKVLPQYANGPWTKIKSTLSALRVQQREMADQTRDALAEVGMTKVHGYMEIGSPGRYVLPLRDRIRFTGPTYVVNPSFSKADMIETSWGLRVPASVTSRKVYLEDYDMFQQLEVPNETLDLVTMYIGLHHCPPQKLEAFVASIHRMLRDRGKFVLRDHDADERLLSMAFLAHSTYNAGLGIPYGEELAEIRNLHPLEYWKALLARAGFRLVGTDRHQQGDPTGNTLMVFEKIPRTPEVVDSIHRSLAQMEAPFRDLDLLPGYHRAQSNTYMTQAEWFLVDIFREHALFLRHSNWYEFPYDAFAALYDKVYQRHREFALREGIADQKAFDQYDSMDRQLLGGIQFLFKALKFVAGRTEKKIYSEEGKAYYLKAQARFADWMEGYAEFMGHTPWYQFPYLSSLEQLDREFAESGGRLADEGTLPKSEARAIDRSLVRHWRRLLRGMSLAAWFTRRTLQDETVDLHTRFLIEASTEQIDELTPEEQELLTSLGKDRYLVTTERYLPFSRAMLAMARTNATIHNVAGNRHISVIFRSNHAQLPQLSVPIDLIQGYQYPTSEWQNGEHRHFYTVRVRVEDLPRLLVEAPEAGLEMIRVHDY